MPGPALQRAGVGFQRDFGLLVYGKGSAAGGEDARDLFHTEQAGRAAAEEDGAHPPRFAVWMPRHFAHQSNFGQKRAHIGFAQG